ncbi:MAG: DUF3108 domain-containing protein [Desulfomonile tiedjei]|nr:DUF3108 domain-containing protein [Desulfomonile tiedjei]
MGAYCKNKRLLIAIVAGFSSLFVWVHCTLAAERSEVLRYEVTWNGNKAGHGDITTKANAKEVTVVAQAVSDGVLKAVIELWSQIHAKFTPKNFKPQTYKFHLKSSLSNPESVDLAFDHKTQLVQVNKQKGSERESHCEKFSGVYDPITAIYLLRHQADLSKPMFVDIYDGKDRSRLLVNPAGNQHVKVKTGMHQAVCLDLRLVKLTGDKKEVATGKLWISNDEHRIPLLLTSSPIVGTIRFELVQAQL